MDDATPVQKGEEAPKHPLSLSEEELPFWVHWGGPIIYDKWTRRILKVPEGAYAPMPHAEFQNVLAWTALNLGGDIYDVLEEFEADYPDITISREKFERIAEVVCGIGFAMGDGVAFDYPYGRERWIGLQFKLIRPIRWLERLPRRIKNHFNPPPPRKTYTLEELWADLGDEDCPEDCTEHRTCREKNL